MDETKLPKIENLVEITADQAAEYVWFVATMRHNQNRYFKFRSNEALETSKRMERELDALNAKLLNPTPRLF